jgi:hypothetical protein
LSYLFWLIDHNLKDIGRRLEVFGCQIQIQNQVQLEMAATIPPRSLVAYRSEEMAIMQTQLLMESMVAGNVQNTVPFGEVNSGVWSELLP